MPSSGCWPIDGHLIFLWCICWGWIYLENANFMVCTFYGFSTLSDLWPQLGCGFLEQWGPWSGDGVSLLNMTFDLYHVPSQVEDPGGVAGTGVYQCVKALVTVLRWCCSTHERSEMYHCGGVWWSGVVEVVLCILDLISWRVGVLEWCCCVCVSAPPFWSSF